MPAIVLSNLTKRYGACTAVDDLTLSIERGELFALLGVNGAGKTTTIRMLCCLEPPSGGDAVLLGNSIRRDARSIKRAIGVSPQETAVAGNLTVAENLALVAGLYGQDGRTARRNADAMLARFGLSGERDKRAKRLSGGMQRRLSIAMALITDPQILFLDEPTLGLDVLARRELWGAIRELKGRVTIILTTHYLDEVEALSDRVGILSQGRLAAAGTVGALIERTGAARFEDAFVALSGAAIEGAAGAEDALGVVG